MDRERLKELVTAECRRLAKLGSAEAIADELHSRGMFGYQRSDTECPIARGLCDTLMLSRAPFRVVPLGITLGAVVDKWDGLVEFEGEFSPLRTFVHNFDAGKYPNLVA